MWDLREPAANSAKGVGELGDTPDSRAAQRERKQRIKARSLHLTRLRDRVFVRKAIGWLWLVVAATTVLAFCALLLAMIVVVVASLVAGRMKDPWFLRAFATVVVRRSHDLLHGALELARLLLVWPTNRGR